MGRERHISEQMTECFYEGVLEPHAWIKGLQLLCELAGSEQSAVTTWDRRSNLSSVWQSVGLPDACCRDFVSHYCDHDPARGWIDRIAVGDWYVDHRHVGEKAMGRSVFYQDFLRPYGLGSVAAVPLQRKDAVDTYLVIQHGLTQSYARQCDPARLKFAVAHLRRAVRLRREFEGLSLHAGLAQMVLSQLHAPLLVTDESGYIVLANAAAESLLRRTAALTSLGGRISLTGTLAPDFRRLLSGACGLAGPRVAAGIQVFGPRRESMLQIVATPLPERHLGNMPLARPLALVLIHDPDRPPGARADLLRQIYGLSPSEARVTLALLKGADPQEVALQSGVSVATIRSQLRSIFRKTATSRQAELIRMMTVVLMVDD